MIDKPRLQSCSLLRMTVLRSQDIEGSGVDSVNHAHVIHFQSLILQEAFHTGQTQKETITSFGC